MPRYDGTGPQGQGPLSGRGEGYCAVRIPETGDGAYGVAGQNAGPVGARFLLGPWWRMRSWFGRGLGRSTGSARGMGSGRGMRDGRGMGRGRGRRSGRW